MLNRRQFIAASAATVASGTAGVLAFNTLGSNSHASTGSANTSPTLPTLRNSGNVLVVLQLQGGNDGLNTLIPMGVGHGRYRDLRPTLGIANPVALTGNADFGLHASLAPLAPLWDAGRLAAVAGVGFPNPNRSHFEALRWWWSGTVGAAGSTGWLGRYLDAVHAEPLQAIALGGVMPALTGATTTPTMVLDPSAFHVTAPKLTDASGLASAYASFGDNYRNALDATTLFKPSSVAAGAKRNSAIALLGVAADLIVQDRHTNVITVSIGGFDTHSDQLDRQAALLTDIGNGIANFFEVIDKAGLGGRVMLMTTSEFGRRAAENGNAGTDHGKAGAHFLIGAGVSKIVVGSWDFNHLDNGDLPLVIDARAYFANGIAWLGGDAAAVMGTDFAPVKLLAA